MFCACQIIQLFSAVFYMVRAGHKPVLGLVINETANKWEAAKKSCSDRDRSCWQDLYVLPWQS